MPIDVTDNYVRIRQRNPSEFQKNTLRTITLDRSKGIRAITGRLKGKTTTTVQTLLLPTKSFTKTQAISWAKAHDFKASEEAEMETTELQEAVWTTAYVNTLADGNFLYIKPGGTKDFQGKTTPRNLRMFPYKDSSGKVDLPHLRNALARIPQSKLDSATKKRVAAKARRIAADAGINVSEEFLDPAGLAHPLFEPHIFETLAWFNSGEPAVLYTLEQVDMMGERLARRLSVYSYQTVSADEYDDDGHIELSTSTSQNSSKTRYEYANGVVRVMKSDGTHTSRDTWGGEEDWDEDVGLESDEDDDGDDENLGEAYHGAGPGVVIKSLRRKRRMTRAGMAADMTMTAQRLKEIEEDGDADDNEIDEIAGALKVSKKRLRAMIKKGMTADIPPDSKAISQEEGDVDVDDIEVEDIDINEDAQADGGMYELMEEVTTAGGMTVAATRLGGRLILESSSRDDHGTVKFTVPMIKVGALTANNNRYSLECCNNIIKDIQALREGGKSRRDDVGEAGEKLSVLHINSPTLSEKPPTPTMLPTHGARVSEALGNPLTSIAGVVTGARLSDDQSILFIEGETIPTQAGKDVTVLIERDLVNGVSLAATPAKGKFRRNEKRGYDVDRIHFLGSDFTNNPAMPFEADEAGFRIAA